jgi:hypothetical protein
VETKNLSACGTVNLKVCKPTIALRWLYLRVIVKEGLELVIFITRTSLHVTVLRF